jgi:hypothetical protein
LTVPVLEFYVFVCSWVLHLADPAGKGLPLSSTVPPAFGAIPEHIISDLAAYFDFVATTNPAHLEMLSAAKVASVAKFYAVFLGNQTYMKQTHLRSQLVEVLFQCVPDLFIYIYFFTCIGKEKC